MATALFGHDVTALEPPSQYSQHYTQAQQQQQQQHASIPHQQRQILLPTAQLISSKTVRFPSSESSFQQALPATCMLSQLHFTRAGRVITNHDASLPCSLVQTSSLACTRGIGHANGGNLTMSTTVPHHEKGTA